MADTMIATSGAATAGRTTLPITPSSFVPSPVHLTPSAPRPARVAPMSPPNRAWEELEGRPSSQVSRFQMIPPARPARTMTSRSSTPPSTRRSERGAPEASWMLMTALVTVSATSTERKAPTRLSTAEGPTATLGRSAPVAMDIAIALPVSWKPLVKSNARAVMTTRTRMTDAAVTGPSVAGSGRGHESAPGRSRVFPCRSPVPRGARWRGRAAGGRAGSRHTPPCVVRRGAGGPRGVRTDPCRLHSPGESANNDA